jgi:hypothetical protein
MYKIQFFHIYIIYTRNWKNVAQSKPSPIQILVENVIIMQIIHAHCQCPLDAKKQTKTNDFETQCLTYYIYTYSFNFCVTFCFVLPTYHIHYCTCINLCSIA